MKALKRFSKAVINLPIRAARGAANWFDKQPTVFKIVIYSGVNLALIQVSKDLEAFKDLMTNSYLVISTGVGVNLVQWGIVQLGTKLRTLK